MGGANISGGAGLNISLGSYSPQINTPPEPEEIFEEEIQNNDPNISKVADITAHTTPTKVLKKPTPLPPKKIEIKERIKKPRKLKHEIKPQKLVETFDKTKENKNQTKSGNKLFNPEGNTATNGNNNGTTRGKIDGSGSGASEELKNYQTTLQAWLEKHKRYPKKALRKRIEGQGTLYFKLDRIGNVVTFELRKKTGSRILDREIEAMLRRASPMPTADSHSRTGNLEFVIPISFRIYNH